MSEYLLVLPDIYLPPTVSKTTLIFIVHCTDKLKSHYISMNICYCCLLVSAVVVFVVVASGGDAAIAIVVIARYCLDVLSSPATQYKNKNYISSYN